MEKHFMLNHIHPLLVQGKMVEVMQKLRMALDIPFEFYLNQYFPNVPTKTKAKIRSLIDGVDHLAVLALPNTNIDSIKETAYKLDLNNNHQYVQSIIISKELGRLLGRDEVVTHIFKAWGVNRFKKKIGVEIFIPQEQKEIVVDWIERGISEHISLRVKSKEAYAQIQKIMAEEKIHFPDFMGGKAILTNEAYYENLIDNEKVRVEFTYAL